MLLQNFIPQNQRITVKLAVGGTRNYCVWYYIIEEKHFDETLVFIKKLNIERKKVYMLKAHTLTLTFPNVSNVTV